MISTELKKRKEEEYEMQLFGFHSRSVDATLQRIVEDRIQRCCKKLCESMEKICKTNENEKRTLKCNGTSLTKLYRSHSQPHIKTIKNCTRKFVTVPQNVLLDEDKGQEIRYTEEEFFHMEKHLKDLQLRAKRATTLRAILEEEIHLAKEFEQNEEVAETLISVMENSLAHPDIDNKLIKGVDNFRTLEKIIKQSSTTMKNVYKNCANNIRVEKLNLDDSRSHLCEITMPQYKVTNDRETNIDE